MITRQEFTVTMMQSNTTISLLVAMRDPAWIGSLVAIFSVTTDDMITRNIACIITLHNLLDFVETTQNEGVCVGVCTYLTERMPKAFSTLLARDNQ